MTERAVVYPASRMYYEDVLPSVKSVLYHDAADYVYLLAEDDELPEPLPPQVEVINVSGQKWFRPNGPNTAGKRYAYLCLLRTVYARIFPEHDRILSLDADTIVLDDLSELWELDMDGCYLAGVPETKLSRELGRPYINMGVALFNLQLIRQDGLDQKMLEAVNRQKYKWSEQDCINDWCSRRHFGDSGSSGTAMLLLGPEYNASKFSEPCDNPKIIHYAYTPNWQQKGPVLAYGGMSWAQAVIGRSEGQK